MKNCALCAPVTPIVTLGLLTKRASLSCTTSDSSIEVRPAARTSPINGTVIMPSTRTVISCVRSASFHTNSRKRSPAPMVYAAVSAGAPAGRAAGCAEAPAAMETDAAASTARRKDE